MSIASPNGALCRTELQILYDPPESSEGRNVFRFRTVSSTIKAAAIWEGRFGSATPTAKYGVTRGFEAIKDLLPHRWKGVSDLELARSAYSEACKQAKCDTVHIPEWP